MIEIQIGGRKWPMRATIGAWMKFEKSTGLKMADLKKNSGLADVVNICRLAFHYVQAGCKANGTAFEMSIDEFLDEIEVAEMELVADAIAKVMNQTNQKKQVTKRA